MMITVELPEDRQHLLLEITKDGFIAALWRSGFDTVDIAAHLQLHRAFVANRLAAIRDAGYQP